MKRKETAITLISLVITIVVLIILSAVVIYLSLGNNGIFVRSKQAKEETNKQEATDIINLKITTAQMNKYAEEQRMPTLKELSLILGEDSEIQYVTEKSQIASTKYEVGEKPTSIYTKLNKYPYEFEINAQLQLASINGKRIITAQENNSLNMCNPKHLTSIVLPSSEANTRPAGTYKASDSIYTKTYTNDFEKYLEFQSGTGWTVKLSGWYVIKSSIGLAHIPSGSFYSPNKMLINGSDYALCALEGDKSSTYYKIDSSDTIYLQEGSKINFYHSSQKDSAWHSIHFGIYALFE